MGNFKQTFYKVVKTINIIFFGIFIFPLGIFWLGWYGSKYYTKIKLMKSLQLQSSYLKSDNRDNILDSGVVEV